MWRVQVNCALSCAGKVCSAVCRGRCAHACLRAQREIGGWQADIKTPWVWPTYTVRVSGNNSKSKMVVILEMHLQARKSFRSCLS